LGRRILDRFQWNLDGFAAEDLDSLRLDDGDPVFAGRGGNQIRFFPFPLAATRTGIGIDRRRSWPADVRIQGSRGKKSTNEQGPSGGQMERR
jgi:hypothetical protein